MLLRETIFSKDDQIVMGASRRGSVGVFGVKQLLKGSFATVAEDGTVIVTMQGLRPDSPDTTIVWDIPALAAQGKTKSGAAEDVPQVSRRGAQGLFTVAEIAGREGQSFILNMKGENKDRGWSVDNEGNIVGGLVPGAGQYRAAFGFNPLLQGYKGTALAALETADSRFIYGGSAANPLVVANRKGLKEAIWDGSITIRNNQLRVDDGTTGRVVIAGNGVSQPMEGVFAEGYLKFFTKLNANAVGEDGVSQSLFVQAKPGIFFRQDRADYSDPVIKKEDSLAEMTFQKGSRMWSSELEALFPVLAGMSPWASGRLSDGSLRYFPGEGGRLALSKIAVSQGSDREKSPLNILPTEGNPPEKGMAVVPTVAVVEGDALSATGARFYTQGFGDRLVYALGQQVKDDNGRTRMAFTGRASLSPFDEGSDLRQIYGDRALYTAWDQGGVFHVEGYNTVFKPGEEMHIIIGKMASEGSSAARIPWWPWARPSCAATASSRPTRSCLESRIL